MPYGSKECAQRKCRVSRTFDHSRGQVIVTHGGDSFAAAYGDIDQALRAYDEWVTVVHRREDAGRAALGTDGAA